MKNKDNKNEKNNLSPELDSALKVLDAAFLPFGTPEEMEIHGTMVIASKLENAASIPKHILEKALEFRGFRRQMFDGVLCWIVYTKSDT